MECEREGAKTEMDRWRERDEGMKVGIQEVFKLWRILEGEGAVWLEPDLLWCLGVKWYSIPPPLHVCAHSTTAATIIFQAKMPNDLWSQLFKCEDSLFSLSYMILN